MTSGSLTRVMGIVGRCAHIRQAVVSPGSSVHQDLQIQGDDAEQLVDHLAAEFGDWIRGWPCDRYVDFNEPPARLGPQIWKWLGLSGVQRAFPGYTAKRLEAGHIAAVIDKGEWFEP